jgi:tRNA(Ile)-lysidine synthase
VSNQQPASLADAFERALQNILARVSVLAAGRSPERQRNSNPAQSGGEESPRSLAVAYSGGLDSSALLHLADRYARDNGLTLFAFHIHHGISPNADSWLAHCESECARLGIRLEMRQIGLAERKRDGLEQAARIGRYAALGELCRLHRIPLLLTAHHLDDQAETVLLQMLRGSGVAGLGGMENANIAPELIGTDLVVARPLLGVSRNVLERFVASQDIAYIEDESNADPRYTRNALRHQVTPLLAEYFRGYQQRLARAAQHAQAARRLLDELAAQDLTACQDGDRIDLNMLKQLNSDRIDNVLRYWMASHGMRMPATAWLGEMRTQIFEARDDARVCVTHPDCEIRRHRNRIFLVPRTSGSDRLLSPMTFRWRGESCMHFPEYGGSMHFDREGQGVDSDWLMAHELMIRPRNGGEKLKLAPNRPTRSLKHHYQALDVPAWERGHLPIVLAAGQLLFAAGVGLNWQAAPVCGANSVMLRWVRDCAASAG